MRSSNLIAAGRSMATVTTCTSTTVNCTSGQGDPNCTLVGVASTQLASGTLSVHSSHVLSSGSVQSVILQQVTYDNRFETRGASVAPLVRQNIGLSDTSDGMLHGVVVIATIVVEDAPLVTFAASVVEAAVVEPAGDVVETTVVVVATAAVEFVPVAPAVVPVDVAAVVVAAAPGAVELAVLVVFDALAFVAFGAVPLVSFAAGKRLAVMTAKRLDWFVLFVLFVALSVVFPGVAAAVVAAVALPALCAAVVVAAVAAVVAVATVVVAADAVVAPVVVAPDTVVAPAVVAPAVVAAPVVVGVARRRTLGSGPRHHSLLFMPFMYIPQANLYPPGAEVAAWFSPATIGAMPNTTTRKDRRTMVILKSTQF